MNTQLVAAEFDLRTRARRRFWNIKRLIQLQFCMFGYAEYGRLAIDELEALPTNKSMRFTYLRYEAMRCIATMCFCREAFDEGAAIGYDIISSSHPYGEAL